MSANSPSEQYAENASCSAAPGMPSEETIREIVDDALNSAIAEPWEVSAHATQRILSLIRPAFEAKDAEIERLKALPVIADYIEVQDARRAAEAKLAQAVEALAAVQPYLGAIVCYASTLDEHDGNRVARLVTSASAAASGEA